MKFRYFIGLDVGGTFIRGTIIDVEGNLRNVIKDVGANPAVVPREKVIEIMSHIIREPINKIQGRPSEVACIGVGSAGVGKGYWRDLFVKAAEENGVSRDRVYVYEDYRVAHVACFLF